MSSSEWALIQLSRLLPLDEDSLKEVIEYSNSLSKNAAAEHLKNLLGDSPQVLEFISNFNARRNPAGLSIPQASETSSRNPNPNRGKKKGQQPLHELPARRPQGFGDVEGALAKKNKDDSYIPSIQPHRQAMSGANASSSSSRHQSPSQGLLDTSLPNLHIRTVSPSKTPSSRSSTRSPAPSSAPGSSKKPNTKLPSTTQNLRPPSSSHAISDLDSALRSLEITTNPTIASPPVEQRRCSCMGSKHPLLLAAPNCLSCGKIICAKEGLAPCTFCGAPLISSSDVHDMARALREERGRERMTAHNSVSQKKPVDSLPNRVGGENVSALAAAQAHRDKLLGFQSTSEARTRLVDEAAAFETPDAGTSAWASPIERARRLKQQQKVLREMQWDAKPEYEKKRIVVSLDVVGGTAVRKMGSIPRPSASSQESSGVVDEEILDDSTLQASAMGEVGGAFSHNPLLGKLVRPIWRDINDVNYERLHSRNDSVFNDKGKAKAANDLNDRIAQRSRKRLWRRVQDDNDDNEALILDGGIYGRAKTNDTKDREELEE